jgi:diaminobutyrate-2-oxoglutarate transaminase
MTPHHQIDSAVRSYSRKFPAVFSRASGSYLYDDAGRKYIDFLMGAGALNYGHNEPRMKQALIKYIESDGVMHGLDLATTARHAFLDRFQHVILAPRSLDYRVQFTGPTGANAVEAALKLARKVKKRRNVIAFTHAYHGLSLGALALTANSFYRDEAFVDRNNVTFMPFDGYLGRDIDGISFIRRLLEDSSSGIDHPAAVIVETIQAEGGVNVASVAWLRDVQALCREFDILLIVDDIQVGCGRTCSFFSFEEAGLLPDIVVLSKAISGFGFPMAVLLIRPDLDQWKPGEHSGTFRGNGAAFVTAEVALSFWEDPSFSETLQHTSRRLAAGLQSIQARIPELRFDIRGRGLIWALDTGVPALNERIQRDCFLRGLIVELCGANRSAIKLLPPLTVSDGELEEALQIIVQSLLTNRQSVVTNDR